MIVVVSIHWVEEPYSDTECGNFGVVNVGKYAIHCATRIGKNLQIRLLSLLSPLNGVKSIQGESLPLKSRGP